MTQITEHLRDIVERVARAARHAPQPTNVTIVAVSKQKSSVEIDEAFRAGQRDFGESYVQEAMPKIAALRDREITWHFIGALQANKTRLVAENFHWVHTVDRAKIATRLSEQRPHFAAPLNVLIEVNQAHEAQKSGVTERDVVALARAIVALPRLTLRGLMTIPPADGDPVPFFRKLAALQEHLRNQGLALDTLSMGMSADFETAIAAGSNCVRIGTAIFGSRA